jgi:hypothetical protein
VIETPTNAVTLPQSFSITATQGSTSITRVVEVVPPAVAFLSVSPSPVVGGTYATASTTLSGGLGFGLGESMKITTTGPISANSSVFFPYGATNEQFTVETNQVLQLTPATVTVSLGTYSKTVGFNVYPALKSATFGGSTVIGGDNANLTVTTYLQTPASGQTVYLNMKNYSPNVSYPGQVYLQPGATQIVIPIGTRLVAVNTPVVITVSVGSQMINVPLTLVPAPITGLTFSPSNSVKGGTTVTGTLTLGGESDGVFITILSSSSVVTSVGSVYATYGSNSAQFTLNTKAVTTSTPVTITVKYGGSQFSSVLTLTP